MRKIIISFLVILMIAVIGMTVFFIKSVYFVNSDDNLNIEERIETTKSEETSYYDEDGILHEFWNSGEVLSYPEDVSVWSMQNKDMRTTVIYDAMQGREWDWWTLRNEYPVTENFFREWDENGWNSLEVLFPGYKYTKEYNPRGDFALYVDDFEKEDKEGIAHAVVRSKYYDTRYDFKYYLDDDYKLDKIEYLSQEIAKDYTKEVEKKERIYLMIKEGNEIHKDNEYITVLWNFSDSINMTDFSLDRMGIVDELKEKKYKENCLPISYDVKYGVYMNKDYADYDKKEAEVYIYYEENHNFEKYLISFDYDDNYYLTKYEVLSREDITIEEYKKVSGVLKFGWEIEN